MLGDDERLRLAKTGKEPTRMAKKRRACILPKRPVQNATQARDGNGTKRAPLLLPQLTIGWSGYDPAFMGIG